MYIINSAFSLSTIVIETLNRIWDPTKSEKQLVKLDIFEYFPG